MNERTELKPSIELNAGAFNAGDWTTVGRLVLRLLFRFRRSASQEDPCTHSPCETCFSPHLEKTTKFISQSKPIHFILPAFPAKSPNRRKVLGTLPDLAERVALSFLQSLCEQIAHFYSPGAKVTLCSDGRVFSDLVCVDDSDVTSYRNALDTILEEIGATSISLFTLDDAFGPVDFNQMRQTLCHQYGESLDRLKENLMADSAGRTLFNGIHRFIFEDQSALHPEQSRNKLREASKERAYQVIQRSNAWSNLVAKQFPESLRLSIHPQPAHSTKIGIQLMSNAQDEWITPWHGVLLDTGTEQRLVRRSEAERLQATLVWRKGRPSHFVAPHLSPGARQ